MVSGGIFSSPRGILSPVQALELANIYLANAHGTRDPSIAMVLCHDTEVTLSHAKKSAKHAEMQTVRDGVAIAYIDLGKVLESHGKLDDAQTSYKKAEKLGGRLQKQNGHLVPYPDPNNGASYAKGIRNYAPNALDVKRSHTAAIPEHIFPMNIRPPPIVFKLPAPEERLSDTTQLVCCLGLLQVAKTPDDILDPATLEWIQTIQSDQLEQERLKAMVTDVLRVFKRDELKDARAVAEVVHLAPVLEKDDFQYLIKELYSGIAQSDLLDVQQLEGLAQLVEGADPGYLDADDMVKILTLLSTRLRDTHHQSSLHMHQLTMSVSRVLDAMADTNVKDLDREKLHEPLLSYLEGLKDSSDPYLVYQAAYAFQSLLYVPDNETLWQTALRRTGKVFRGVSGLVKAVREFDLNGFIEGLKNIQKGLAGASNLIIRTTTAIERAISVAENGRDFVNSLEEGLSFSHKRDWYPAVRLASALLQDGQFSSFKELVCKVPCRHDVAFLQGVCQHLSEVASDPTWDAKVHQSAIEFLGEIYRNDAIWGQQASVKQWIITTLIRLSSSPEKAVKSAAETLLGDLESTADPQEQLLFQACQGMSCCSHPVRAAPTGFASPSLLERAQNKPDVETHLRHLMKQRLKGENKSVYIPPQAKAGLNASDDARFSLIARIGEFIASEQKVFLLLGDSGAGKSTFIRALECDLWKSYKKGGPIPLHINLPAINKPDQDMIAKQLRRSEFSESQIKEFSESQIKELKTHREFILICDGYDESQQTHNLYTTNRLNHPGEWQAKMVISCRSEYLGADYLDRFQPKDRNMTLETTLFQEAVITPFSIDQVEAYVSQYVAIHQPSWEAKEYKQALNYIPSLKDLVRNPFLMSLSLEVLPRMMDPEQGLSATRITKVALYDQFVEHWLERGKKRLGEKALSPQARAAFENLSDEGFTKNGIDFLKKLSVAIYKEQDGHPIVKYSRYKDKGSWKSEFFSREEEKQLLREACPLTRNGNQHGFIHRSLLEYGLTRAVFDPEEYEEISAQQLPRSRRGSTSSVLSFEIRGDTERVEADNDREPDIESPLAWRSFVNEPSLLQFLEDRVNQEPMFKQRLLAYIEYSKKDKKWRTAAANAITILVRAGVEFRSADLRGIRIPGADLSYGVFESANLQGADMKKTNLRNIWLYKADLSKSKMVGVQFGELPPLKHGKPVLSCMYSRDGGLFAVGLENGTISAYAASNWETLWTSEGHHDNVVSVAFSPDGNRIVSGSWDTTLRLWDATNGQCRHIFMGHTGWLNAVAYSPQGDSVASGSRDHTVRLWSVISGNRIHVLIGHTTSVTMILYSPNGDSVASCSADMTVRFGHTKYVSSIAYSPQGDLLASASDDNTVRIWEVGTGNCRHILTGHSDGVRNVIFSPRGNQIASRSMDRTMRLWDSEAGRCIHTLQCYSQSSALAYSTQGDLVASDGYNNTVQLWDAKTGECRRMLTGNAGEVRQILFPPKGDHIASVDLSNTIQLWDMGVGTTRVVSRGHEQPISSVQYSSKRRQIASCSDDGTIRLWDAKTGACLHKLIGHNNRVLGIAYSPNEDRIASFSKDRTIRLWDTQTGACLHTLSDHEGGVLSIAFSPKGDRIISCCSNDNTVWLWNVETGECEKMFIEHNRDVTMVSYSPRGDQVASCSEGCTVLLWNVETGERQHILAEHTQVVRCIMYSPNGKQIASCSSDQTVRLWNVETGVCDHVFHHQDYKGLTTIVFSTRGRQIAAGCSTGKVVMHDVKRKRIHKLIGHKEPIECIAFSRDDKFLLSSDTIGVVRLWVTETGSCRWTFHYDMQRIGLRKKTSVAWIHSKAAASFITGSGDGSVRVWKVIEEEGRYRICMQWRSVDGRLSVEGVRLQDVEGLSDLNKQLLKERGAEKEASDPMCKTITIADDKSDVGRYSHIYVPPLKIRKERKAV
ncbi:MAG: hypothetical protein J3Q66DRAFT_411466 [Benniella sp.]|nr:MAG: hypothetical protein J3Q66DRAFT_411466 [Benniella sp.]